MKNQTSRYHYSLFHLTWPVFLEMVLQIMVGSVDQLMMSQFSQVGVTAIGNANQIITFVLLLFNIVSSAALILISQYLGAGKEKKAVQFYSLSLFLNGSASFLLSVLFILAARPLFTAMRVPGEALSDCILYFRIIAVSFFVQALFVTFSAILKAHAFMKEYMAVSVVMNLLNILGNWLLIPSMGVAGVALSSTASRMAGLGFLIFFFVKRLHTPVGLSILKTVGLKELRQLLSIGLPTGGEGLSYNLSQMGILIIVNSLGTYAVNTKIYVGILANISCLFAVSISQAVQVIVGHAAGAQDYDYARQRVRSCLGYATAASFVMSVLLYALSGPIFSIFTDYPEILALGKQIMLVEIVLEFGRAVNNVMIRSLQVSGDVRFPTFLAITCQWSVAFGLSCLFAFGFGWGLIGVWLAMAADECIRAFVLMWRWHTGAWQRIGFAAHA